MFNKILNVYNSLFPFWVIAAGTLAFFFPTLFLPLKNGMELFFAVTMFGVGMVMDPSAFADIMKNVKTVIIGVVSQFSIMPLLAWFVATAFMLPDDLKLGLILAGSAPGAMASNVLCYLAGADVAYSVSLTTASTLLAPLFTPLLTLLLAHTLLKVSFTALFLSVIKMVIVPLLLGIGLKKALNTRVEPFIKVFPAISTTFITFICALVIALNKNYLMQISGLVFLAAVMLNLLGLILGYAVGSFFEFNLLRKRALAIEIGMQNAGLGSVLALKHFNEKAALPSAIFVFICIISASMLASYWSRRPLRN